MGDDAHAALSALFEHTDLDPQVEFDEQDAAAMGRYHACRQSFLSMIEMVETVTGHAAQADMVPDRTPEMVPGASPQLIEICSARHVRLT